MDRNVIVFGATGRTGLEICKYLKGKGINASAFVRKGSLEKLNNIQIKTHIGDVMSEEDLQSVFDSDGYTDVVIALGSKELKNTKLRSKGTSFVLNAIKKTSSNTKVHVDSAFGVGDSWDDMGLVNRMMSNLILKSVMKDHGLQEKFVKDSGLDFHIIRPVGLKDGKSTEDVFAKEKGKMKTNTIKRVDLAKYIVEGILANKSGISSVCQNK